MERLADQIPAERAAKRWIISTDPEEHVERIRPYVDMGFRHLVFHAPGPDQARFINLYADQVLPRLRAAFGLSMTRASTMSSAAELRLIALPDFPQVASGRRSRRPDRGSVGARRACAAQRRCAGVRAENNFQGRGPADRSGHGHAECRGARAGRRPCRRIRGSSSWFCANRGALCAPPKMS